MTNVMAGCMHCHRMMIMYFGNISKSKMTGGTPEVRSDKSLTLLTFGPMDQWINGILEHWNIETLKHLNIGKLEHWNIVIFKIQPVSCDINCIDTV